MSLAQKILLSVSILVILILVGFLTKKKLIFESRRNSFFLKMIANISSNIDKLDSDLDEIFTNAREARNGLKQLAVVQREKLIICGLLRNKRKQILKKNITKKSIT